MRCEELAERLTDLMEGTLADDVEAAALEHLATCDSCEQVLADTEAAVALARDHGRIELDDTARRRLLDAIVGDLDGAGPA